MGEFDRITNFCSLERLDGFFVTNTDDVLCRNVNQKLHVFQKNDVIL